MANREPSWIAFSRSVRIAEGCPREVAAAVKTLVDSDREASVLVFDALTSDPVEIDLRGTPGDVLARLPMSEEALPSVVDPLPEPAARAVGRPRLGVAAREVTLLPRHWDWLARQPGGASVALRKLVEQALRTHADADRVRQARESTYRFMTAMAGNEPHHEEAVRALFAGNLEAFAQMVAAWPADVRQHTLTLAEATRPLEQG
jgi:hypothetical protein